MSDREDNGSPTLLDLARRLQRARAKFSGLFPRDVFRNSAWEMMLELFVAAQLDRMVCVKELILVSGEPSTSALRRIDRLEAAGLLHRSHDSSDHRRVAIALTDKGHSAMRTMLHNLFIDAGPGRAEGSHG